MMNQAYWIHVLEEEIKVFILLAIFLMTRIKL